jgi:flagellar hook-associated protein 1 FlgK
MAGNLTVALGSARSGLLASQGALDIVANNIANVNNPVYSRKNPTFEQRMVAGVGSGVQLGQISRNVDEGLMRSLRQELGALSAQDVQGGYFERLQDLFGRPEDNVSLSHILTQFSSAVESLAVNPQDPTQQREMVRWAQNAAFKLNDSSTTIQDLRLDADQKIGEAVEEINQLAADIADLNRKISRQEALGTGAADLLDQRDQALSRLSELIDIKTFAGGNGEVVVMTGDGKKLAGLEAAPVSHVVAGQLGPASSFAEGELNGIFVDELEPVNDITTQIRSGELYGLIELRDKILPNLQSAVDTLAAQVRDTVNQAHNRGAPYPGMTEMNGTRTFIDPANQTVTFSGNGDTTLSLFDGNGDQVRSTTVRGLIGGASATIQQVADAVNAWLGADGSAVIVDDHLQIEVTAGNRALALRDQTTSADGSPQADAVIQFDANFDGSTDETVNGFSSFFGLNDFFVDHRNDAVYESDVVTPGFTASAATLTFRNAGGPLGPDVIVGAGDSLADIADAITNTIPDLTASAVPDGTGFRLRVTSISGESLTVTQDGGAGDRLLTDLDLHSANVGVARSLAVRADIVTNTALVSRGVMQWDAGLGSGGEYFLSEGDETAVRGLATAMTTATKFDTAGGLDAVTLTLDQYAAGIIAESSLLAENNESHRTFQGALVDSLRHTSDSIRGVNLDQEMADLMLYEQAYSAAARVISVIQSMFDSLEDILR